MNIASTSPLAYGGKSKHFQINDCRSLAYRLCNTMTKITTSGLRKFNLIMASFHAAQGIAILLLSRTFDIPITGSYLTFDHASHTLQPATAHLFDLSIPLLVAIPGFNPDFVDSRISNSAAAPIRVAISQYCPDN
jgi:hypothetical protein